MEIIHIRLHPDNINKDNGIDIPEARIPMIKKHNGRPVRKQTAEGTTWSQTSRKIRTHRNNGDRNPPIALDRRDANGNARAVDPIVWWRLTVSSRNVAIYLSSDYLVRQTIKQFDLP